MDEFQRCPMGTNITKMNVNVTFHVSFFHEIFIISVIRVKTIYRPCR